MEMSKFSDPSLLSTCGGDTVKIFDVSMGQTDPCTLSYSPSPGYPVYSVKWSHTNLVVASAGEDKKISLWRINGQFMGTIPIAGSDTRDKIEESIFAINFSNKGSRYICTGGSSKVVRIWDLRRKRCIKWLRGHTDMITGAMYNSKDEHLASISLNGVLVLHNLASGVKVAELKDPNQQVLRALDYSRISRHLLVTSGDDGSIHLWDTTGRSPKVSWLKQHSAPTAGVSFSPSSDKMIASVGLDKKLYTFDRGSRRPSFCIPYEMPFSSLAFRDDGWTLAAGTSSGQVVFYDVRGKPQPFSVLRAYGNTEAVTSLCWQRSKPLLVDESNCSPEILLMGGAAEDSVIMPDPLPVVAPSSLSLSMEVPASQNPVRLGPFTGASSHTAATGGSPSSWLSLSKAEGTPSRSQPRLGGPLPRLRAPLATYNVKDDMDVFSPLVEVQPLTPTLDKLWNDHEGAKKDYLPLDMKSLSLISSPRKSPIPEGEGKDHPILKVTSTSRQDDTLTSFTAPGSSVTSSSKIEESSITPVAWGGERFSDKFTHNRRPTLSRFGMMAASGLASGSTFSGLQELSSWTNHISGSSSSNQKPSVANLHNKDLSSDRQFPLGFSENFPSSSISPLLDRKAVTRQASLDLPRTPASLTLPRRFSAERLSTGEVTSPTKGSPKTKKTGAETGAEIFNGLLNPTTLTANASEAWTARMVNTNNVGWDEKKHIQGEISVPQQGTSFTLQMLQSTLEETLYPFQQSIHKDMRNLHIEILRQFHMQETEISSAMSSILENQAELKKEIQSLRKENQQLRRLL